MDRKPEYITIKVRVEDHKRLKIEAAKDGVSMMDKFSEIMQKAFTVNSNVQRD